MDVKADASYLWKALDYLCNAGTSFNFWKRKVLGKETMKNFLLLLFKLPQMSWIKHERCIFRAISLHDIPFPPRPNIKWWVLQIPDVRWKCPSLPRSPRALPRNGPPSGSLLHQLFPQHLSHWQTVWWEVFSRNVQTGPPGWLQVRNSIHCFFFGFDALQLNLVFSEK